MTFRFMQLGVIGVLSLLVGTASAQADHAMVPYVATPVTIDGVFSPGEWDGALTYNVEGSTPQTNPGWNPLNGNAITPADLSYTLYLKHDSESFYVAFDVTDDSVSDDYQSTHPLHTEVWNDDCTEVFIDGDVDRDVTESASGSPVGDRDWREGSQTHFGVLGQSHWENNSGYKDRTWWAATARRTGGYRTEYRFAFRGIDVADGEGNYEPLKTGDTVGFSALANDDDNGGAREDQLAWWGGGTNDSLYRTQANWGYATMLPPAGYVEPGIPTRAENVDLIVDTIPDTNPGALTVERVFPRLNFEAPLLLIESPDTSRRLFVPEMRGRIKTFVKATDPAPASVTTFLDIASRVRSPFEGGGDSEEGLLGLAFDPDYATNGEFYVYYSVRTDPRRSRLSRFTANPPNAATVNAATEEVLLEVPKPAANHNGGMIAFGPDNMLYIGTGDGGGAGDNAGAGNNSQNTTLLLGKMLRIDVRSAPDAGLAYHIPTDNPFYVTGPAGTATRKEIYAYGLRNPWRWSFDRETGAQIVADVGQDAWEEVNVIKSGGNYGWRIMEGNTCYNAPTCNTAGIRGPIATYAHDLGISITGGFVYYGSEVPSLYGKYLYGDYSSGRIWSLTYNPETETTTPPQDVTDLSGFALGAFGQDQSGEVYLLNLNTGAIYVLRPGDGETPTDAASVSPNPPVRGQSVTITYNATARPLEGQTNVNLYSGINGWTGITTVPMTSQGNNIFTVTRTVPANATVLDMVFNNGNGTWDNNESQDWHFNTVAARPVGMVAALVGACDGSRPFPTRLSDIPELLNAGLGIDQTNLGIIPYEPNAKLWSDNARKERFLALPSLDTIGYTAAGGWDFSEDAVIIKNFILPLDDRNPDASLKRIETRLLVKSCDEWYGFSYEWNEAQTDATLLTTSKKRPFEIIEADGSTLDYEWQYPSRDQCSICHTNASNNVLGLTTAQLNHDFAYPHSGNTDNQLHALNYISIFGKPGLPAEPAALASMPSPFDTSASLRDRARAYLAANCAQCHQPGGGGGGGLDMRWETADDAMGVIGEPASNDLGIPGAQVITPGDATRSVVYLRMHTTESAIRMPPLATSRIDEQGSEVVRQWIESLRTLPVEDGWMVY